MRRFVITIPNLSVGGVGTIVDANELGMDDDKLNQFVAAGFAAELHDADLEPLPEPDPEPEPEDDDEDDEPSLEFDTYDPSQFSVPKVQLYIDTHPELADEIIAAERDGKNRSGIVNGW